MNVVHSIYMYRAMVIIISRGRGRTMNRKIVLVLDDSMKKARPTLTFGTYYIFLLVHSVGGCAGARKIK